ncbi:MAG: hypothetical protein ACEQR8_05960 [Cypionkella sp.]
MNPRYVLAVSLVLLFVVSELASEGGAIDSLARPETAAAPQPAPAAARAAPAAPRKNDFFADYEPPDTEGWPTTAGDVARTALTRIPDAAPGSALAHATGSVPLGALPLERLGVELPSPTGVAPDFVLD